MNSPLILIDDKHIPVHRIVWVADVPHFCGEDDCLCEGQYEVRLDVDDSVWTNQIGRDAVIDALRKWYSYPNDEPDLE